MLEEKLAAYQTCVIKPARAQVEELNDAIAHSPACPECNSYDVSKDELFSYHWCGNCHHVWEQENFTEAEELSNAIARSILSLRFIAGEVVPKRSQTIMLAPAC